MTLLALPVEPDIPDGPQKQSGANQDISASGEIEVAEFQVEAYLYFGGRCEEALEFYASAIGASVEMVMRFSESPDPMPPGVLAPGFENKIMHASFRVGQARVMASDGCDEGSVFSGFSLALSAKTNADATEMLEALADGGTIKMPLTKTFWSPLYGTLTDRFGINWMVMVALPH